MTDVKEEILGQLDGVFQRLRAELGIIQPSLVVAVPEPEEELEDDVLFPWEPLDKFVEQYLIVSRNGANASDDWPGMPVPRVWEVLGFRSPYLYRQAHKAPLDFYAADRVVVKGLGYHPSVIWKNWPYPT